MISTEVSFQASFWSSVWVAQSACCQCRHSGGSLDGLRAPFLVNDAVVC